MSQFASAIGRSSLMMAAARAIETERADGLFQDPLAAKLAGEDTIAQVRPSVQKYEESGAPIAIVRTRFFDDFLLSKADRVRQIAILGAGMDTRAFRLPWHPDTHIFELDSPEVIEYKESVLGNTPSSSERHPIAVDLREPIADVLINAGYRRDVATLWLMEGSIYYFNEAEVRQLLETITGLSAPGSWLGVDFINSFFIGKNMGELSPYWQYGCDDPESLLSSYNWSASVLQASDEGANYGRFTYKLPPRDVRDAPHYFFAQAVLEQD